MRYEICISDRYLSETPTMKLLSRKGLLTLSSTILASGMAFLMGGSVNLAIPDIQADLGASFIEIQWILNSYAVMLAVFILISGTVGDRFGRVKVFRFGIILFTVGAFLSGIADSSLQLIGFRILQGLGGAMMIPSSLAIINSVFPEKSRGKAIGLWSGLSGGVAAIGGPVVGGVLVENFGWRSVFLMVIPLGVLAWIMCLSIPKQTVFRNEKGFDIIGTVLSLTALGLIIVGLTYGPEQNWNPITIAMVIVGLLLLIAFGWSQKARKHTLIDPDILIDKTVLGANLATLFLYTALNGFFFFFVINMQQLQGYSATVAGFAMLPTIALITVLSGVGGALADRYSNRILMTGGSLLVAAGMFLLALGGRDANYFVEFLPGQILIGLGMALVIAPLTKSALTVAENQSGMASGLNNAVSRVAAVFAVAVMSALLLTVFRVELKSNLEQTGLLSVNQSQLFEQSEQLLAIEIPETFSETETETANNAIADAFVLAYRTTTIFAGSLGLLSAAVSFLLIERDKKATSSP